VVCSRLFVGLPSTMLLRLIGVFLLAVAALRHTRFGRQKTPAWLLLPAGIAVGFLSGVAGSAGPLGAAVFLGLRLPGGVYVATEAVTAVLIHLTKTITYGRYAASSVGDLFYGLALGGSLVLGSWTGREVIGRLPERGFALLVEVLLVASALTLMVG
jgi:hypothetical protein